MYDKAAARAMGMSDAWIVRRTNEVHHIAMGHVVDQIRKISMPRPYRFADGETRMGVVRLAFMMGDQPGQDKHLAKTTKGCGVCMCPADKLDSTVETFPARNSSALLRSMRRLAESCLDNEGRVIRGRKKLIEKWERSKGMRFLRNHLLEMVEDLNFSLTVPTPRDFLHCIILGLFGHHIIKALIYLIQVTLLKPIFLNVHSVRRAPIRESVMRSALARLAQRLSAIDANESCITITPEFSEHFLKVFEVGKPSFTGSRMNLIMLVLPHIIRDFFCT